MNVNWVSIYVGVPKPHLLRFRLVADASVSERKNMLFVAILVLFVCYIFTISLLQRIWCPEVTSQNAAFTKLLSTQSADEEINSS